MKKSKLICAALSIGVVCFIIGCKKDEVNYGSIPANVFIVNEGGFGNINGSISAFNSYTKNMVNDIFKNVNQRPLGDIVQSMKFSGNKGFIVVNVSSTVEVVNRNTFISEGTINGFASPRYFLPVSANKAYVSDWSDNNIKIIDINALSIAGSIPTGTGPEQMLLSNNKVFVTNVGGFGIDSTVTVIDANTDAVIATLNVGLNPNSIELDANGKLWVLCSGWYGPDFTGGTADDIAGKLLQINPVTNDIEAEYMMQQFDHPIKLAINNSKNELFYLMGVSGYEGAVYKFKIDDSTLPTTPLINKNFYGLGINPSDNDIYCGYSPVFGQSGYMFRFLNNGTLKDSLQVGIGPNGFIFNY